MSELNQSMHVRVNKSRREQFNRVAKKQFGMTGSDVVRLLMDAATDGTVRIVITEKTKVTIKGVHINA